jgi:hypothetical protein
MEGRVPTRLTTSEGHRFAFVVALGFAVVAGILWWRGLYTGACILAGLAAMLALAGLLVPTHLGPIQRVWMALATAISKVTTPIIMGAVYFLVITPVGLLMRLLGRNPVIHSEKDGSYWHRRPQRGGRVSDLERQF